jgi:NADH-quinone oxidoreductase subunit N
MQMTITDVITLLPLILLSATVVVLMLVIAFYRNYQISILITLGGQLLAFLSLFVIYPYAPRQITPLIVLDGYSVFYMGLLIAASFTIVLLSYSYFIKFESNREEYFILITLSTLGSSILVSSNHFASFFLGLEILSVSLYTLISYQRYQEHRIEAGIKYLVLAGTTAAFLLFGMALIYAELGTMEFSNMAFTGEITTVNQPILLVGWGLLTVGIAFKLALVPFQVWTPDVYQGAPLPVTAFIATISKGGMFALMLRFFTEVPVGSSSSLWGAFAIIAILSMLLGNILAIVQSNVKRILAYSSIAHLGYLLVAFLAGGVRGTEAVAFYFVAYFITSLSAFGVITILSRQDHEMENLDDFKGMFWRYPLLGIILTVAMLSLAGIPPMVGFYGKFYIAFAGVDQSLWLLLIVLVGSSVIGLFYYLRVVITTFMREGDEEAERKELLFGKLIISRTGSAVLSILGFLMLAVGIFPGPLLSLIEKLVSGMG